MPECEFCGFVICLCEELGIERKPGISGLPINIDAELMRSLPAYRKKEVLDKYHVWLTKVREQERLQERNRLQRIYNATHPKEREQAKIDRLIYYWNNRKLLLERGKVERRNRTEVQKAKQREAHRKWYVEHKDNADYRKLRREKGRQYYSRWRGDAGYRERVNRLKKEWYAVNKNKPTVKERIKSNSLRYYLKNKEKILARHRELYRLKKSQQ